MFLLKLAIVFHNLDRSTYSYHKVSPYEGNPNSEKNIRFIIKETLLKYQNLVTEDETELVITAVLNHSKKNSDDDPVLQQILMDIDRLDRSGATGIAAGFMFMETVKKPLISSIESLLFDDLVKAGGQRDGVANLAWIYEWFECEWFRIEELKTEVKNRAEFVLRFYEQLKKEYSQIGMLKNY